MSSYNHGCHPGDFSVTPLQDTIDFYSSFDNILALLIDNVPFGNLLQAYGQRAFAPVAWVVPEISAAFDTYVEAYITSPETEAKVAAVIDAVPMGSTLHALDLFTQFLGYII